MSEPEEDKVSTVGEDLVSYNQPPSEPLIEEARNLAPYDLAGTDMIRTQIHLTPRQRKFLTERATTTGKSMALQIRELIDKAMKPSTSDWDFNPLLDEPAADPSFEGGAEDSLSPDLAIYGNDQE